MKPQQLQPLPLTTHMSNTTTALVMILFQSGTTALHGTPTPPHGTTAHHGTTAPHGTTIPTMMVTMITGSQIMKLKNINQALQLLESALIRPS